MMLQRGQAYFAHRPNIGYQFAETMLTLQGRITDGLQGAE